MTFPIHSLRPILTSLALIAMTVTIPACHAAAHTNSEHALGVAIPESLRPPPGHVLLAVVHGRGEQIYARAKPGDPFTLKASRADLFNERNEVIGTHFAGPTWQGNGGQFVGKKKASAASPDPNAIDWLLIEADPAKSADRGVGLFSAVTYIQRINTQGGKAPANETGDEARVKYEAEYLLYGAAPATK